MNPKDKKQEDFAKKWMNEIKVGRSYRKKYSSEESWEKYRNWFRGNWNESTKPVNMTYAYMRSLIPRVYFRTPSAVVLPTRPEFVQHARVVEAIDNWLIRSTGLKKTIKKAILDAGLCGIGPIKLGYDSEFGYIPDQAADVNKGTVTQNSTKTGDKIEYRTTINPGMPWALRVKPDDVITPWGYDDPESLPWICHTILRPLDDVKQDQKYKNTKDLKGGYTTNQEFKNSRRRPSEEGIPYTLLYEIRDLKRGRVVVLCEGKVLLDIPDELQVVGMPWEFLIPNEDPEHFWGVSDIKIFEPQQVELNEISAQASKLRRFSLLHFLYKKGALTPEALDKLLSSDIEDIGAGVEINDDVISTSVEALQPRSLTNDLVTSKQETMSDMRDAIGFSRNQMGEMSPYHNKTATEAQIVNQASEMRTDERKDQVADLISNILRKWNQIIFSHWDEPKVIEIVGADGIRSWIKYTGEQLKGEYFLKVEPDVGYPISRSTRMATSKDIFEMFKGDPLIDQVGLRKQIIQQYDFIDPTASLLLQDATVASNPAVPGEEGNTSISPMRKGKGNNPEEAIDFEEFMARLKKEEGK